MEPLPCPALHRAVFAGCVLLPLLTFQLGCPLPPVSAADDDAPIRNRPPTAAELIRAREKFADAAPRFVHGAVFDRLDGKTGSHAPTIVAFDDGELLAAWFSYDGPRELQGAAIFAARRAPGAAEWSPPTLLVDRPEADGNPVLYREGARVWLFQAVVPGGWSTARIDFQISADRGETWGPPRTLSADLGSNVRFPPVRRADGVLLLPAYDDLFQTALFFTSADGEQWTRLSSAAPAGAARLIQPAVVERTDGQLLLVGRNTRQEALWTGASADGGATWALSASSGFANPGSPAQLLRLRSGALLLVFNDDPKLRRPLAAALSFDEGLSWTPPRPLADGPGEYAYPAAMQDPAGVIHVLYSNDRENIGHVEMNELWLLES